MSDPYTLRCPGCQSPWTQCWCGHVARWESEHDRLKVNCAVVETREESEFVTYHGGGVGVRPRQPVDQSAPRWVGAALLGGAAVLLGVIVAGVYLYD